MALLTFYLPKMGESIMEALILRWFAQEGELLTEGDPFVEVATDKVDAEIAAPHGGRVKKLLVATGSMVAIGAPIALLEVEEGLLPLLNIPVTDTKTPHYAPSPQPPTPSPQPPTPSSWKTQLKLSPLGKRIAQAHALPREAIEQLIGRSKDNRITKDTLLNYLNKRNTFSNHPNQQPLFQEIANLLPGDEMIQMDRVRQLIADRMVQSKKIAPHVTSFIRADLTNLVQWRKLHKAAFKEKYGFNLTYMPLFTAAVARTLQHFPLLNAIVSNNKIIKKKHINIGFAIALSDGKLVVPVLPDVERLDLITIAQQMHALIHKARNNSLTADELRGATYTLSNIGSFGNLMGTPIIVQPQVAILALGAIERRPAVVTIAGQEEIAIRDETFLSHTYDHRIIDGAIGGGFLQYLAKELHSPPSLQL